MTLSIITLSFVILTFAISCVTGFVSISLIIHSQKKKMKMKEIERLEKLKDKYTEMLKTANTPFEQTSINEKLDEINNKLKSIKI